jgi:hypothetical protein
MVALYMDENVRAQITQELRRRGVDVMTVQEDGQRGGQDSAILDRSTELGRVLYSEDADLLIEAHARQVSETPFPGVAYGHQRLPIGQCIDSLELFAKAGEPEEYRNQVIYIPL